jgi:uncharacterized repeat protein (TIGR01451 family)
VFSKYQTTLVGQVIDISIMRCILTMKNAEVFFGRLILCLRTIILAISMLLNFSSASYADNENPPLEPWNTGEEPFPDCDPRAFMMRAITTDSLGQLAYLDLSSRPEVTLIPYGPQTVGYEYNAMGYNPKDNFLYAVKAGRDPLDLLRIGADGVPRYVGTLDFVSSSVAADFDEDGYLYVSGGNNLQKFEITDAGPVAVWDEPFDVGESLTDWGYRNGALWGVIADINISDNKTTAVVTRLDLDGPNGRPSGPAVRGASTEIDRIFQITSVFPAKNGIYGYDTAHGGLYRVDIPSDNPADATLQYLAKGSRLEGSDGAKCMHSPLGLPAEVSVVKTAASSSYLPGDTVKFTIRVENEGPWGAGEILLEDPLPSNAISAAWTCTASDEAVCRETSGTGSISVLLDLTEVGSYVTFEVTMETDPNASEPLVNIARITVPEDFEDNPGNNTAEAIVPLDHAEFSVEKSGTLVRQGPFAASGDTIDYKVTVRNDSQGVLADVSVSDPGPQFGDHRGTGTLSPFEPPNATLDPGAEVTFTATYTITEEDLTNLTESGGTNIVNVATASVTTVDGTILSKEAPSTVVAPGTSRILVEKFAQLQPGGENSGVLPGDTILYTVRLTNESDVALSDVRPIDEGPTFSGQPGTGIFSLFEPPSAHLAPWESAEFKATYTLTETDIANGFGPNAIRNVATATGSRNDDSGALEANSAEAFLELPEISISKTADFSQVARGGTVPFTIRASVGGSYDQLDLVDTMPAGFIYVKNSATINNTPVEPQIAGRRLVFPLDMQRGRIFVVRLVLAASASVQPGKFLNYAHTELPGTGEQYGPRVSAEIEVPAEPVFDCGEVLGRVFEDRNRNAIMDNREAGVAGVRLIAVEGMTITTDSEGRFHLTCADLPSRDIGSTFLLKLDPASLPSGFRILSENPRAVRLTAGKVTRINFATAVARVIRVDVNSDAFVMNTMQLRPEWQPRLHQLIALLRSEPSILRLSYIDQNAERALAGQRVNSLRDTIRQLWKRNAGNYRLEIEYRILTQTSQGWDDPNSISWVIEE